jgi:hypothetical protein
MTMAVWIWILVAAAGLAALSLIVGLIVARVLGAIGREISNVLQAEVWSYTPLMRGSAGGADIPAEIHRSTAGTAPPRDHELLAV